MATPTLPPLLRIPMEIKLHIFSYLEGPEPTLIILRRTHSHFRSVIPKVSLRATLSETDYRDHLIAAEKYANGDGRLSLFPPKKLVCFRCFHILPVKKFSNQNFTGKRRAGGKALHKRFCIACELKGGCYRLG